MKDFFLEEELCAAAKKVRDAKLSTIPESLDDPLVSEEFEKNIRYLYKKEKRIRFWYITKKCVAAVVLVIVIGASALLIVSGEARAAVTSWFKDMSKMYTFFSFEGDRELELPVYKPLRIPENYTYKNTEEVIVDVSGIDENGRPMGKILNRKLIYVCTDDDTKELTLRYGMMQEENSVYLRMDDAEYETKNVYINGAYGELYRSKDTQVSSVLVWFDEDKQMYFLLIAYMSPEEMIEIAESVCIVE